MVSRLVSAVFLCLLLSAPAAALPRSNPADRLVEEPIEESVYDRATRCLDKKRPGVQKMVRWLEANTSGAFWGSYRCEKWGRRSASLHAEGRAIDWHLDVVDKAQRREAYELIELLLEPDSVGNQSALARRMGVQEIIWDCRYWGAWGSSEMGRYGACFNKHGKRRKRVDKTVAHRDHLHIGLTKDGAMGRTSFWQLG